MPDLAYHIVDVFAERKYAGNPLAVFIDAGAISSADMQAIAREVNYSETAFITASEQATATYQVRIFTPAEELPFAGHPSLGTAWIINQVLQQGQGNRITLHLPVGLVPVTFESTGDGSEILWMKQPEPSFGKILDSGPLPQILGLPATSIDANYPIQEVSTGLPFIIVPLKDLPALQQIVIDRAAFHALIEHTWAQNILVFCPQTHHGLSGISARVFTDYLGIPEDPATGSGNGCLAAWLSRQRYWGRHSIDVRSEQGYEIGRPSVLFLKASEVAGKIVVRVGGQVVPVAQGVWPV
jgi:trans-2,3-dihydro-3-hydroxyanthranilate isomerase